MCASCFGVSTSCCDMCASCFGVSTSCCGVSSSCEFGGAFGARLWRSCVEVCFLFVIWGLGGDQVVFVCGQVAWLCGQVV